MECSFSSLKTDGAVPPATDTLFETRRSWSLFPCIAYDFLLSLGPSSPCVMETFLKYKIKFYNICMWVSCDKKTTNVDGRN